MKKFLVERDNGRNISFASELIASSSSSDYRAGSPWSVALMDNSKQPVAANIKSFDCGNFGLFIGKGLQLPVLHGQYSTYQAEQVARQIGASIILRVD